MKSLRSRPASRHVSRHVLVSALGGFVLVATTGAGCNAILDNDPGVLVVTDEAGTLPDPDTGADPTPLPRPGDPVDAGALPDAAVPDDGGLCPPGLKACDGTCVPATSPAYGCAAESCAPCAVPRATATCTGGACAVGACDVGFADCNGAPADGCETDLAKAASCGGCNAACPPSAPTCAAMGGAFACVAGCPPAAPTRCGDECVDVQTNPNHCGACGAPCAPVENATVACAAGACTFACRPEFRACAGRCVAQTDPTACGAGCVVCPPAPNARPTCTGDACGFQCEAGFGDCDLLPGNGCETALATNPAHCGACGRVCPSGVCNAGVCAPGPDAGGG